MDSRYAWLDSFLESEASEALSQIILLYFKSNIRQFNKYSIWIYFRSRISLHARRNCLILVFCLLVFKALILNLLITSGTLWVSKYEFVINQGNVLFISITFLSQPVIRDILMECIGFLENFTKLLEKSYQTLNNSTISSTKLQKLLYRLQIWRQNSRLGREGERKPCWKVCLKTLLWRWARVEGREGRCHDTCLEYEMLCNYILTDTDPIEGSAR